VDQRATAEFRAAAGELARVRDQLFEQSASQIAELAVMIAGRVIARELTLDPTLVVGLVKEGLDALGAHDRVRVRLGRGFAEVTTEIERDLNLARHKTELCVEDQLDEYACFVETEYGSVDESIEARLATLLQGLTPDSERP
jgi:flagellar assembly protein FliH